MEEEVHEGVAAEKSCLILTVGGKLVSLKDSDAEDVLVNVFNVKLAVEVPLGVQSVVERPGRKDLSSHRHLTVRVTFA